MPSPRSGNVLPPFPTQSDLHVRDTESQNESRLREGALSSLRFAIDEKVKYTHVESIDYRFSYLSLSLIISLATEMS